MYVSRAMIAIFMVISPCFCADRLKKLKEGDFYFSLVNVTEHKKKEAALPVTDEFGSGSKVLKLSGSSRPVAKEDRRDFLATGALVDELVRRGVPLEDCITSEAYDGASGETAVGWATCHFVGPDCLCAFVQHGVNVNISDAQGMSPLARLITRAQQHVSCDLVSQKAEYLMRHGAQLDALVPVDGGRSITCAQFLSNQLTAAYLQRERLSYMRLRALQEACARHYSRYRNSVRQPYIQDCLSAFFNKQTYYWSVKYEKNRMEKYHPVLLISQYEDDLISYDSDDTQDTFFVRSTDK